MNANLSRDLAGGMNQTDGSIQRRVRVELALRDWDSRQLARHCGLKAQTFRSHFARPALPNLFCWRLEAAFDYELALVSSKSVLFIRKACKKTQGIDPFLISDFEHVALARKLGIVNPLKYRHADLLREIIARLSTVVSPSAIHGKI
jgi:hypothetical protein